MARANTLFTSLNNYYEMLTDVFLLGTYHEYVATGVRNNFVIYDENFVYDNLLRVERFAKKLELSSVIIELINRNKELLEKYDKEDKKITMQDPYRRFFSDNMEGMSRLILSELEGKFIFESVKECALDKECLIKLSRKEKTVIFDDELWDNLGDLAISDYSDAAKCILMGASTPAAMITLRAAEEAVRMYYRHKIVEDPGKKAWGTLINELKRQTNSNEELLEYLNYIRKSKRNLAQHPEKIYSQREAERIFMEVISMLHDIFTDMT